jgi:hypothetical protein
MPAVAHSTRPARAPTPLSARQFRRAAAANAAARAAHPHGPTPQRVGAPGKAADAAARRLRALEIQGGGCRRPPLEGPDS